VGGKNASEFSAYHAVRIKK